MYHRSFFGPFATGAARAMGHPLAFLLAVLIIVVWAVTGPFFAFSDTWQLVINTSTTIVTFLMGPVVGPNLAKAKFLAKYSTVNQVDRLHGGTKPAHAGRE